VYYDSTLNQSRLTPRCRDRNTLGILLLSSVIDLNGNSKSNLRSTCSQRQLTSRVMPYCKRDVQGVSRREQAICLMKILEILGPPYRKQSPAQYMMTYKGTAFIAYVCSACSFRDAPGAGGWSVNVLRLWICLGPLRSRSTLS